MMGKISFFLGLQIFQNPKGIFINQSKYALEEVVEIKELRNEEVVEGAAVAIPFEAVEEVKSR
ncbi:hypothetical protein Tco_0636492, partial [Tanacetum coccineum]